MDVCTGRSQYSNGTVALSDLESAGAGITGGYNGDSFTILVLIIFFPGLSMYNAVELLVLIFATFKKYRGAYFWSLLIASSAVIPYSLGFLFKFGNITVGSLRWLSVVLLTIGWYGMVTGQSFVLWSRLHLILEGERGRRTLQWTKWMIIVDAVVLHIPTTVLTFGSNGELHTEAFARGYSVMEKIQMSGFFVQEVILSSIYIVATYRILQSSIRDNTKRLMWQLMAVNIIIIIMDVGLLGLEAASLYLLETLVKGVIYSVKLKLEFAILGQLVQFVGRPGTSLANDERTRRASVAYFGEDDEKTSRDTVNSSEMPGLSPGASDSAHLSRLRTNNSNKLAISNESKGLEESVSFHRQRTRSGSVRLPPGMTIDDVNVMAFQHTEASILPGLDQDIDALTPPLESPKAGAERSKFGDDAV